MRKPPIFLFFIKFSSSIFNISILSVQILELYNRVIAQHLDVKYKVIVHCS